MAFLLERLVRPASAGISIEIPFDANEDRRSGPAPIYFQTTISSSPDEIEAATKSGRPEKMVESDGMERDVVLLIAVLPLAIPWRILAAAEEEAVAPCAYLQLQEAVTVPTLEIPVQSTVRAEELREFLPSWALQFHLVEQILRQRDWEP